MNSTQIILRSRDIFMRAGPLRIAVLLLALAQKSLRAGDKVVIPLEQLEDARLRILEAFRIIDHEIGETLNEISESMPLQLENLRRATCEAMRPVVRFCETTSTADDGFINALADADDMEVTCATGIVPISTEFIQSFMTIMDEAGAKALAQERAKSATSLDEVADVGMRIQMVAINASIEAARAGDVGRGFSVIADETKLLAQSMTTVLGEISDDLRRV